MDNINPKNLTLRSDNTLFDTNSNKIYIEVMKLTGRGQPGLASFYQNSDVSPKQFLIKEDKPATCLMEGTAAYIKDLLPGILRSSINFATVGTLFKQKDATTSVVSIQDSVMAPAGSQVKPWDELVYGHKRKPNTVFSTESWHSQLITDHISCMNTNPKWQLAAGIMGSAIAGDESLHVAQFMAFVDDKKHITGITRIDLGARERCALERSKEKEAMNPYTTSGQYRYNKATAQFGNNYIEFLLAEPTLKKMYTMLWMNLSNKLDLINFITTSSKNEFITQFNSIPELLKEDTLTEALSIINWNTIIINWNTIIINSLNSTPFVPKSTSIEEKIQELASEIARIDALRVEKMVAKAEVVYALYKQEMHEKIKIISDLSSNEKLFENLSQSLVFQEALTKSRVFLPAEIKCAQEMIQTIKTNVAQLISNIKEKHGDDNTNSFKQIQLLTELGSDLLRAATLNLQYFPNLPSNTEQFNTLNQDLNQNLNQNLNQLLTINDCAAYCLATSSPHKILLVVSIMNATMQDPGIAPLKSCIQQNNLIEGLKKGNLLKKATVLSGGELLLLKLSTRYDLNDSDLLSEEEKEKKEKEEWELVQPSEPSESPEPPVLFTNHSTPSNLFIADIHKGNFQNIATDITKKTLTINNFTTPYGQDKKTALHYLMELSTNDQASVDAIFAVLQASIGFIRNTNLEILDSNKKTPLDYLIENKHSSYIIDALKSKKIIGCFSTKSYTLQDFFPKNTFWSVKKSPGLGK